MTGRALRIAVTVSEIVEITPLIKRFRLEPLGGARLQSFSGGAHIVVEIQDGDTVRRNSYSLMGPPSLTSSYTISVRRDQDGRGGSRYLHDYVRPGATLHISHPVNLFPIDQRARKHLFVAGGIGITPFLAMMEQLADEHRPFRLHYAARSREDAAYAEQLAARHGGAVRLYCSADGERISPEAILRHQPLGTHLYVCGPTRMIQAVLHAARVMGWPDQSLHQERFTAPAGGRPYEIRLAQAGLRVKVGASQSMLEAIEAAGIEAPYLCRGGACGRCETRVLSCDGAIIHADHFLSDDEKLSGAKVMPCVSRFEGRELVLDI